MSEKKPKALLLYMEPTTYVLGWIAEVMRLAAPGSHTLFVSQNISQSWNLALDQEQASVLPAGLLAAVAALKRQITCGGYDVVHVSGWGHPVLVCALLLARWYGLPTVVESDTPLSPYTPKWKMAVKRLVYPLLFRLPAFFLPAGTRQAGYFRHYGVEPERIRIGRMTVDVDGIRDYVANTDAATRAAVRRRWGIPEEDLVFLFVGRLEWYKGLDILIPAFRRAIEGRKSTSLVIVGDGSLREQLEQDAAQPHTVRLLGRLQGNELLDTYAMADLLVLPSYRETWGLVVNEAMAAGMPVIASDQVGCVDDLVEDGTTGRVFSSGSLEALQSCIRDLIERPEQRAQMGRAAGELIGGWNLKVKASIMHATWREATEAR